MRFGATEIVVLVRRFRVVDKIEIIICNLSGFGMWEELGGPFFNVRARGTLKFFKHSRVAVYRFHCCIIESGIG